MSMAACGVYISETQSYCTYPGFMVCPHHGPSQPVEDKELEDLTSNPDADPRVLLQRAVDHITAGNPNPLALKRLLESVERLVELQQRLPRPQEVDTEMKIRTKLLFGITPVTEDEWDTCFKHLDPVTFREMCRAVCGAVCGGLDSIPDKYRDHLPTTAGVSIPEPALAAKYPDSVEFARQNGGYPPAPRADGGNEWVVSLGGKSPHVKGKRPDSDSGSYTPPTPRQNTDGVLEYGHSATPEA